MKQNNSHRPINRRLPSQGQGRKKGHDHRRSQYFSYVLTGLTFAERLAKVIDEILRLLGR